MNLRLFWSAIVLVGLSSSAHAGYIEICKESFPVDSLSGFFGFTVAGQSGTFETPVGACTPAFQLPDGLAIITEVPQAEAVFLSVSTFPANRLISFDPFTGSATVLIVPGNISMQTVVTFTNTPIPEPRTSWLIGLGLALFVLRRKLKARIISNPPRVVRLDGSAIPGLE